MSDRIILTPPYPGSQRGSAWADKTLSDSEWKVDVEFRASGPERGSGNMQIWYAKDGQKEIGSASIYTVGKFDGLVLVVDQYGGHGGSIRGFLNDGTKAFRERNNVDSLAFGHCDFSYRNLGHFTHLQLEQTRDSFEVKLDGRQCFKTHKIKMPSGYNFGVSAASAETADSFELSQFIIESGGSGSGSGSTDQSRQPSDQKPLTGRDTQQSRREDGWLYKEDTPDAPASDYRSQERQFEDLHNRMMVLHHQLNSLVHDFEGIKVHAEENQAVLINRYMNPLHDFQDEIHKRILNMEHDLEAIKNDFQQKDFKETLNRLHDALQESHSSLMFHLPEITKGASPRLGFFVFIIIAFQLALAASYVVYKRRKSAGSHAKYL